MIGALKEPITDQYIRKPENAVIMLPYLLLLGLTCVYCSVDSKEYVLCNGKYLVLENTAPDASFGSSNTASTSSESVLSFDGIKLSLEQSDFGLFADFDLPVEVEGSNLKTWKLSLCGKNGLTNKMSPFYVKQDKSVAVTIPNIGERFLGYSEGKAATLFTSKHAEYSSAKKDIVDDGKYPLRTLDDTSIFFSNDVSGKSPQWVTTGGATKTETQ